ncbi:Uma2 family endonuclease [Crossiella sp. CA198]|uniref:Uma2 family endonuclease n=1 Tax=Crossiella sp. CA198 TaxID=3455607 RepID=UPI003F8D10CA
MALPADTAPDAFPVHAEPWTLDEVLAMPEDQGQRVELIDGTVVVSPAPSARHQRVLHRLQLRLDGMVPPHCELIPGVNVVLNGERMLIPDLAVTTNPGADEVYYQGDDLLLAMEIISPSSKVYDRALKRQLYAEARVPYFVLVDPVASPVSAIVYELVEDEYREFARAENGRLELERPFPVKVDLGS